MKIYDNHLNYGDFIKNELLTLSRIGSNRTIVSKFPALAELAKRSYLQYKHEKDFSKTQFEFNCTLELEVEGKYKNIRIEVILADSFSQASYVLLMCDFSKTPPELMRKFHFDYAPIEDKINKKPIYHLQYGGKPTPRMTKDKIQHSHILSWLSLPRINFAPTNLALLFDMVFCEFPSIETKKIVENDQWRQLVKSNEELMIKTYFNCINSFFDRGHHKYDFLYRDFYYGK